MIRPDDIPIDVFVTELAFYSLGRETVENFLKNEGLLRDTVNAENESESTNHRAYIWKMCEDPVVVSIKLETNGYIISCHDILFGYHH